VYSWNPGDEITESLGGFRYVCIAIFSMDDALESYPTGKKRRGGMANPKIARQLMWNGNFD